jgi:hypothetical protein
VLEERLDEPGEAVAPHPQVLAVAGGVLGDQVELDETRGFELLRLGHQALDGAAAEAPAPDRNRAEGAGVVAPLGDLEVREAAGGQQARRRVVEDHVRRGRQRRAAAELDHVAHLAELVEPDEAVDLGDLAGELVAEAVDHAAGHQDLLDPLPLPSHDLEDRVDRLLLGLLDEGAGVDDHRVGMVEVLDDLVAAARQLAQHDLAVDEILRAAEADHAHTGRTDGFRHGGRV